MAFEIENGVLTNYTEEQGVTEVVIPDSVTSIGGWAFSGCSRLTEIKIPDSVTSIGDRAFSRCSSLTEIKIPDSVTSIEYSAFYGTKWLNNYPDDLVIINGILIKYKGSENNVVIPDSVTSIGDRAFSRCSSLTEIKIPDSVTSIGKEVFFRCSSLTKIEIPDSVTSIGSEAFSWCSSLTEIKIPNRVTSIGYRAFYYCSSLTEIKITDSVTSIGSSAFGHCSSLTEIKIPDSVTSIGEWAFEDCSSLTAIEVSENNENYASFDGILYSKDVTELICCPCAKKEVIIPDSVTSIGDMAFYGCSSLTAIEVSENNENYASFDGVLYNKEITKVIHCPQAKKKVIIPDSVTSIGHWDFEKYNLKEITFRNITVPFYATHADIARDVEDVIKMIKNKDFSAKVPAKSKYGMACHLFNENPEDEETFAYIKKNFLKIFKFAIDSDNTEFATKVAEQGKLITKRNIDKLIDYAREKKKLEMSVILMNYKNEHFGFDDPLAFLKF